MRYTAFAPLLLLAACGTDSADSNEPAFKIQSEDIVVMPSEEKTQCFYFHTPNTKAIAVNRWVSEMTPGSHHMIFFVGGPEHADGTTLDDECGLKPANVFNQPSWVFASQTPQAESVLPADDGVGNPIAQVIPPNTVAALQMHYLNNTNAPVTANVKLEAYALPETTAYTRTEAYVTYNFDIAIPPRAKDFPVSASCDAPSGKFWTISTHAHKQAISTDVKDGDAMMFHSTDWEHPGRRVWDAPPHYAVQSGKVSWTCTYDNIGTNKEITIEDGASAQTNEMCMAVGYSFPASGPMICLATKDGCSCPIR